MKKWQPFVLILAVIAGAFWGSVGPFVRYMSGHGISSLTILASRVLVAALLLGLGMLVVNRSWLKVKWKDLWIFLVAALVGMLGLNVCYNEAIGYVPLSLAAILLGLYPIFVMILAALFFKEKITRRKIFCMALALAGAVLASGLLESGQTSFSAYGVAVGFVSAIFYAFYSIMSKVAMQRNYNVFTVTFYALLIMGIALIPFTDWQALGSFVAEAPLGHAGFMVGHSACASVLPYILFTLSLRYADAGKTSILAAGMEPISALILGFLIYRETPTVLALLGMAITIVALALVGMAEKKKTSA